VIIGQAQAPEGPAEEMALPLAFKETEVILGLTRDDREYGQQLLGRLPTRETDHDRVSFEE